MNDQRNSFVGSHVLRDEKYRTIQSFQFDPSARDLDLRDSHVLRFLVLSNSDNCREQDQGDGNRVSSTVRHAYQTPN